MPTQAKLNVNIQDQITVRRFNNLIPIPTGTPSSVPSGAPNGALSGTPSGDPSGAPSSVPTLLQNIIAATDADGARAMSSGFRLSPLLPLFVAAAIPFLFAFL
jgi:hypothetical protein